MKSYVLYGIVGTSEAALELDRLVPRSEGGGWTMSDTSGDPVAYFNILSQPLNLELPADHPERGPNVQADISGRHFHEDAIVLDVLSKIQRAVGGVIRDDNGGEISAEGPSVTQSYIV